MHSGLNVMFLVENKIVNYRQFDMVLFKTKGIDLANLSIKRFVWVTLLTLNLWRSAQEHQRSKKPQTYRDPFGQ